MKIRRATCTRIMHAVYPEITYRSKTSRPSRHAANSLESLSYSGHSLKAVRSRTTITVREGQGGCQRHQTCLAPTASLPALHYTPPRRQPRPLSDTAQTYSYPHLHVPSLRLPRGLFEPPKYTRVPIRCCRTGFPHAPSHNRCPLPRVRRHDLSFGCALLSLRI